MKLRLFAGAVGVLAGLALTGAAMAQTVTRPTFAMTTDAKFDAASIPAYTGQFKDIYSYIDAHQGEHVKALQRWVRQRSISAQSDGITEMAALLEGDLKALGFKETAIVPTSGHPGVWGYYDAGAKKTLVVYMMYDVQPVEPEQWKVPPFEGAVIDDDRFGQVLMARGATNQKGPERAFLNSLASIIAVKGKLPVNLMVLAEGEEELGSPHYPELIDKYETRLKTANGVLFPFNAQSPAGEVTMPLGVKGILYLEVEAKGGPQGGPKFAEIHGSNKAIVDAPAWRLVQALATLTTPDGNTITVPGYYDGIRPPNLEEQKLTNGLMAGWLAQEGQRKQAMGVDRWIDGMSAKQTLYENLFQPTLNIDGLVSGYGGPGTKTITPHMALAKIDTRMLPGQNPDNLQALIRKHLDSKGFTDIALRRLSGYPAAQSSVDAPLIQAALGVFNKYGAKPDVVPRLAGSAPYYVFTDRLKLPMVTAGMGHGSAQHAPNEYMVITPKAGSKIAGLATVEKFYVDLLYALAASK